MSIAKRINCVVNIKIKGRCVVIGKGSSVGVPGGPSDDAVVRRIRQFRRAGKTTVPEDISSHAIRREDARIAGETFHRSLAGRRQRRAKDSANARLYGEELPPVADVILIGIALGHRRQVTKVLLQTGIASKAAARLTSIDLPYAIVSTDMPPDEAQQLQLELEAAGGVVMIES